MVTVEADTHQEGKTPDSRLLEPVVPSEVLSSSFSSAMDCWVNVVSSVDHLASDASCASQLRANVWLSLPEPSP